MTKFKDIKNKTIQKCSRNIYDLMNNLKKFHIKNISNICLDSVFLIFYLEKLGIKDDSFLIMKAHKINDRSKREEKILNLNLKLKVVKEFISKDNNIFLISTFLISLVILILLKLYRRILRKKIINAFVNFENIFDYNKSDEYYKGLLELYKVKNLFLYDDNALLKEKYGKEFNLDSLSEEIILEDFKYYVSISSELNKMIVESKITLAELKYNIMEIIIVVLLYLVLGFTYGYLNKNFYELFGLFSLVLFNLLISITFLSCYVMKKFYTLIITKKEIIKL